MTSLDDALDDEPDDDRFDLYKDDGWSNSDLLMRRHVVEGEYRGPVDDEKVPDGYTADELDREQLHRMFGR